MKFIYLLFVFSYCHLFAQTGKTDSISTEKTQTIHLTDYGINAHIDVPIVDGYEPIITKTGKKKEQKVQISVGSAFRIQIEASPTSFSDAEIYLDIWKKADVKFWFQNDPSGPQPTIIINEPNAYLMQRGKEFKWVYIVTIDKMRYTISPAGYVLNLEDGLRYIRMAKTFFPK